MNPRRDLTIRLPIEAFRELERQAELQDRDAYQQAAYILKTAIASSTLQQTKPDC